MKLLQNDLPGGHNHMTLHNKKAAPPHHSSDPGILYNNQEQIGTGASFCSAGLGPEDMLQTQSQEAQAGKTLTERCPSSWLEELGKMLRQMELVPEGERRGSWREESQRKDVPNSGYVCRSFSLTLTRECVCQTQT